MAELLAHWWDPDEATIGPFDLVSDLKTAQKNRSWLVSEMDKQAWEGVTCGVASFRQALIGGLCCSGDRPEDTEPPTRTHTALPETPG